MDKVVLKQTGRASGGHPWVFSNELQSSPKHHEPGSLVEVHDNKHSFIGIGYINPRSLISIRLLTKLRQPIDSDFFKQRIQDAVSYRNALSLHTNALRMVFSEADHLPGLIVDQYDNCVVVQFLTLGIEKIGNDLIQLIDDLLHPSTIVLRNDSPSRTLEGLALEKKIIKGSLDSLPVIQEDGVVFEVDPIAGQKTGFFLDQRDNRIAFKKLIKGGRGLDLFCYAGAWALHLAKTGARVIGIDSSATALSLARNNSLINLLEGAVEFIESDVFDFIKQEKNSGVLYDFIILDPPAFAKNRSKIREALRAYRDLNAMAMFMLRQGGILATSSCSHHVDRAAFIGMLRNAAKSAGKMPILLDYRTQSRDHPILLNVPETEYLKCAFLRM